MTTEVASTSDTISPEEIEKALAVARPQLDGKGARYLKIKGLPANRDTFTTEAQVRQHIAEHAEEGRIIIDHLLRIAAALGQS